MLQYNDKESGNNNTISTSANIPQEEYQPVVPTDTGTRVKIQINDQRTEAQLIKDDNSEQSQTGHSLSQAYEPKKAGIVSDSHNVYPFTRKRRAYKHVPTAKREELIALVHDVGLSIKEAAKKLGINYSISKYIVKSQKLNSLREGVSSIDRLVKADDHKNGHVHPELLQYMTPALRGIHTPQHTIKR